MLYFEAPIAEDSGGYCPGRKTKSKGVVPYRLVQPFRVFVYEHDLEVCLVGFDTDPSRVPSCWERLTPQVFVERFTEYRGRRPIPSETPEELLGGVR